MSRQNELNSYISRLLGRLRLHAWTLGLALLAGTALATTLSLVFILNRFAFPASGVKGARLALLLTLAGTAAAALAIPLIRLTSTRAVHRTESSYPELEQRLTTFHERQQIGNDPFLELLAADTLNRTQSISPASIAPDGRLLAISGVGLGCLSVLLWMIFAKPGYMGYGSSLLWTGEHKNLAPLYSISVTPGDVTVRRHGDQLVIAHIAGLHPDKVQIFAHYESTKAWEPVAMQLQPGSTNGANYQFVLAGLPENVEYYVAAGPLTSPHYKLTVADLPSVKKIQVTYRYPSWTGLKSVIQQETGDLRAIEGTDARVEIEMDKPLTSGRLALDSNKDVALSSDGANRYTATIHMDKDGAYHVTALDHDRPVRLSEDYFIATDKAEPPQVSLTRPGGDYRASPIEEVTIGVQGADQFGIRDMHLHYSINGGPDHDINMLKTQGVKNADGSHTLQLEDYKLVPGDLVSLYATARDGHAESRTGINFVQIDPFEREFSQSQQAGGGGGGGGAGQNNQTDMSKREKELIAATWKQQNDKNVSTKDAAVNAQFLSDAQNKLRDQVTALSARMESRDLSSANEEFTDFQKDMQQAAAAMSPSADKLKGMQWKDALPYEQKALQSLLRAEATFRKIQVAFGQQSGGGANSAGRDLASLFDLELDTEKNQYETAQNTSAADQKQKEIDDVLAKLDALAKRQEDLAQQQKTPQQSFQERWQQEMLRREAEQLQREMEQLAQNAQQNGSQQSGSSQSGSSQSGRQSGSQSSSSQQMNNSASNSSQANNNPSNASQDQRVQQALSRLKQAGNAMKRNGDQQQSSDASARQAADRLQEAKDILSAGQQQVASSKLDSLSQEADRLTQEERAQSDRINRFVNQPPVDPMNRESVESRIRERNQLAQDRQQMSDDLSGLQGKLRQSSRALASNQTEASQKINRALTEMDQADLDNRVQRTADWLRRGINPNSNGTESEIAKGLQSLSQQLREARKSMQAGPSEQRSGSGPANQNAALDQVRRMREQLQAMAGPNGNRRSQNGSSGQMDRNGQNATGQNQSGQRQSLNGGQPQPGQGQGGQSGRGQRTGQQLARNGSGQQTEGNPAVGSNSGEIRRGGGGYSDGTAWGNINTGNNTYGPRGIVQPVPTDASGNPQDMEQSYRRQLEGLNQLGYMVQGDPGLAKEVQDLTHRMERLDPKRFPGNPALVEQMHNEMLSSINRLELQLLSRGATGEARSGKPQTVPEGYQDAVADYYRRLSNTR